LYGFFFAIPDCMEASKVIAEVLSLVLSEWTEREANLFVDQRVSENFEEQYRANAKTLMVC
jgi:hypothetical protein